MEVFNIEKVKSTLRAGISESEGFKYFMVLLALGSIIMMPMLYPGFESSIYDTLADIVMVIVTVGGTWYVYYKNIGAKGKKFLERYFVLNLVLSVRFALVGLAIMTGVMLLSFLSSAFGDWLFPENSSDAMTIYGFAGLLIFELVYYWRLGVHMGDVAQTPKG